MKHKIAFFAVWVCGAFIYLNGCAYSKDSSALADRRDDVGKKPATAVGMLSQNVVGSGGTNVLELVYNAPTFSSTTISNTSVTSSTHSETTVNEVFIDNRTIMPVYVAYDPRVNDLLSDVFDVRIYQREGEYQRDADFNEISRTYGGSIEEADLGAIWHLYKEKKRQLDEKVIGPLMRVRSELCEFESEASKVPTVVSASTSKVTAVSSSTRKKATIEIPEAAETIVSGLANNVARWMPSPGSRRDGGFLKHVGPLASSIVKAADKLLQSPCLSNVEAFQAEKKRVEELIGKYIEAFQSDPLAECEERYVVRRRHFSPRLRIRSDEALIDRRRNQRRDYPFLEYISKILQIPVKPKRFQISAEPGRRPSSENIRKFIIERLNSNSTFRNYSATTFMEIQKVAFGLISSSLVSDEDRRTPLREICYFWGSPGCGKTTAAEKLAEVFELPIYKATVRRLEDLSQENLEGEDMKRTGWFLDALLEPTRSRVISDRVSPLETYQNGFLVIEDFDRILLDPSTMTGALAFFLDYLDASKKAFSCSYFKVPLNISRLNIIITGNKPIPETRDFDALRERLRIIQFPDLPEDVQRTEILSEHLEVLAGKYDLPALKITKKIDRDEEYHPPQRTAVIDRAVHRAREIGSHSSRVLKSVLEDVCKEISIFPTPPVNSIPSFAVSIDLRGYQLSNRHLGIFVEKLRSMEGLTFLDLGGNHESSLHEGIIEALPGSLRHIGLRANQLNDNAKKRLLQLLPSFSHLETLDLGKTGILSILPEESFNLPSDTLTTLCIDMEINDCNIVSIADSIGTLTNLTSLNLGWNQINKRGWDIVFPRLRATKLRNLDIGYNNINDEWISSKIENFAELEHLESLYLAHNNITDGGAIHLASKFPRGLTSLIFRIQCGVVISSEFAMAIESSIELNKKRKELIAASESAVLCSLGAASSDLKK